MLALDFELTSFDCNSLFLYLLYNADSEELTNPPATDKHPEIDSKQLPCEEETKDKENLQNEHPEEVSSCKDPATSVEESSKDFQELVIAVHRTSGNQLCPEIMISPVSNKPFSFTTGNVNAEHPASISANPFKGMNLLLRLSVISWNKDKNKEKRTS